MISMDGRNYEAPAGTIVRVMPGESITLQVGASTLVMKKDGSVTLNGKQIDVVGSQHIGLESKRIDLN